jgi:protein-disulfide isomerase
MRKEGIILVGIGIITLLIVVGAAFFLSGPAAPSPLEGEGEVTDSALLLGPEQERMTEGTPSAKVTIVEFGDLQCPACGAVHPVLKQIVSEYKDKVYFVFRNFPLPMHPNAPIAAQAAYAAGQQGKFWEMHDMLYESQDEWAEKSSGPAKETIVGYAQDLELDMTKFNEDLNKNAGNAKIQKDQNDGYQLGVNSTPTLYINGTKFAAVMTYDQLKKEIDDRLK